VLPLADYILLLVLAIPFWWLILFLFGEYSYHRILQRNSIIQGLWRPALVVALVVGASVFIAQEKFFSRRVVFGFIAFSLVFIAFSRIAVLRLAAKLIKALQHRNLLLIGSPLLAEAFVAGIGKDRWGLNILGFLSDSLATDADGVKRVGAVKDLERLLETQVIDDVVVVAPEGGLPAINEVIRVCEEVGARVHIQASCFEAALSRPHFENFRGVRFLTFSPGPYDPVSLAVKRVIDIALSLLFLIVLSPAMLAVSIAVAVTSKSTVIYTQLRSGINGRSFRLYKFRSMVPGAEEGRDALVNIMDGPVFKANPDPRITRLGRFIRRYSLDELPQLWNVLKGDMSLVGPRPALPDEVEKYQRWQRRRLSMRPGMTGLWQVSGRNRVAFQDWMRLDLEYIDSWSLGLDLKLLLKTIPEVFRGSGI
jgi:exopolysaccharide biosynthesis polyprenyl glycosylphosphotransferase